MHADLKGTNCFQVLLDGTYRAKDLNGLRLVLLKELYKRFTLGIAGM